MSDVAALVRGLRSRRRLAQRQAAVGIELLAEAADCDSAACDKIVAAGCVPLLAELLHSDSAALQEPAVSALMHLTLKNQQACAQCAGAVPALVAVLRSGAGEAAGCAAQALGNLAAKSEERCAAILAAGGHTALLQLCTSGSAAAPAMGTLFVLAADKRAKAALLDASPFPALVSVLRQAENSSGDIAGNGAALLAANTIRKLCCGTDDQPAGQCDAAAAAAAASAGAPAALLHVLRICATAGVQFEAARALACLCSSGDASTQAAVAGASTLAARLGADGYGEDVQVNALRALSALVAGSVACSTAVEAVPGALSKLVQLLGGAAGSDAQSAAAIILVSLARAGKQAAAAIVAAGVGRGLAAALSTPAAADGLQRDAASLAKSLAAQGQAAALLTAGVEQLLQPLLASSDRETQQAAAAALGSLGSPASEQAQRPRRTCDAPGCDATSGLRRCGGCGTVRYCGEACCRAHWKAHRGECRRLQAERAAAAAATVAAAEARQEIQS